ncbi:non-motor microtubule binding protein [Lithospermum erythrorhizon]|uniref:Non-motor microtubule binding protein n=1 Tax=Lithospermum erythrorhizon TaxID=34254 RepID=A0AAV3P9V2_LITER
MMFVRIQKKLTKMIGGSGQSSGTTTGAVQSTVGIVSSAEALDGYFLRRSAASMLSEKRPVAAAPTKNKATSSNSGVTKKGEGIAPSKTIEAEDVEPAEMSLEEIESRLGSLIHADTISQLKSAVWKERLEAICSFKEQVESVEKIDSSVEIVISLLCAVPGWSEKNVEV